MSKFKSATDIAVTEYALKAMAMGAFAIGTLGTLFFVSSVCTAQYCTTCSGGNCSPQFETPVYSGSTAAPVAYESSLSNGYSQSYTPSYSSSENYGYPSPVYSANTYSGSPVMANSFDYGTVINSTYASPSYEQLDSSFIPSTTVSNISTVSTPYASSGSPVVSDMAVPTYDSYPNSPYVHQTDASSIPVSSSMPTSTFASGGSFASNSNMNGTYSSSYMPTSSSMSYPVSGTFASYSPSSVTSPSTTSPVSNLAASYGSGSGLAQQKAYQAANMGMLGHVGGGLGGCRYEGVGWSTVSPDHAITKCCYWGQRPVSQIGVAKGQDGMWYACVLYQ